jgi:hypothetical protein
MIAWPDPHSNVGVNKKLLYGDIYPKEIISMLNSLDYISILSVI